MKKQLLISLSVGLLIALPLLSVGGLSRNIQDIPNTKKNYFEADFQMQQQLGQVFLSSQALSEALVLADIKKAQSAAQEVEVALSKVNKGLLPTEQQEKWNIKAKALSSSLSQIKNAAKINQQREAFAQFSKTLYKSLKAFGIEENTAYYHYCPMALDGEGAYWLSSVKQIRNPYLGKNMLTCGSTKEVLK